MEDHRGNEERLESQLQETRERYQRSCDEIQELRGQLSATASSLEEQYQLLSSQVGLCNSSLAGQTVSESGRSLQL